MRRAWRLFVSNPSLLAPAGFMGIVNFLLFLIFSSLFFSSLIQKLKTAGLSLSDISFVRGQAFITMFSKYMLAIFCLLLLARALIGALHHTGWAEMFAKAARGGRTTLSDYFSGVISGAPRHLAGAAIKVCIQSLPVLAIAVVAVFIIMMNLGRGTALKIAVFSLPVILIFQSITSYVLTFWRPALIMDDTGAAESFSRSAAFVRGHPGAVTFPILLCAVYILIVTSLCIGAAIFVLKMAHASASLALLQIFVVIDALIFIWFFIAAGLIYFRLLFHVIYFECAVAPAVAAAPETGQPPSLDAPIENMKPPSAGTKIKDTDPPRRKPSSGPDVYPDSQPPH